MPLPVQLVTGEGKSLASNESAELLAGLPYDLTSFKEMSATGTAYNFYPPKGSLQFCITGLLVFANKDVSDASDTIIEIYETGAADSTTVDRPLLKFGMGKLTVLPYNGFRIMVNEGVYINAKTDDATIFLNILGVFIKTVINPI